MVVRSVLVGVSDPSFLGTDELGSIKATFSTLYKLVLCDRYFYIIVYFFNYITINIQTEISILNTFVELMRTPLEVFWSGIHNYVHPYRRCCVLA